MSTRLKSHLKHTDLCVYIFKITSLIIIAIVMICVIADNKAATRSEFFLPRISNACYTLWSLVNNTRKKYINTVQHYIVITV